MAIDIGALQSTGLDIGAIESGESPDLTQECSETLNAWATGVEEFLGIRLFPGDDLNSWGDSPILPDREVIGDAILPQNDLVSLYYGINVVPLTKTVSDTLYLQSGTPSKRSGLIDSLSTFLIPELEFALGDSLGANLQDNTTQDFIIFFNEAGPILAYDTMMYNWADEIANAGPFFKSFFDNFTLSDFLASLNEGAISVSDTLGLLDSLSHQNNPIPYFTDSMSQSDGVTVSTFAELEKNISDGFVLSDGTPVTLPGTAFLSYIRRYLNDII